MLFRSADENVAMLRNLDIDVEIFPVLESEIAKEIVATRFSVLERLASTNPPNMIVASIPALMQMTPSRDQVSSVVRRLRRGQDCSLSGLQQWLVDAGYERRATIEEASQFATRGGILDIATADGIFVRLDFLGDTIESMNEVDPISLGSDSRIDEVIVAASSRFEGNATLVDHLPDAWCALLDDVHEISQQAKSYFDRVVDSSGLAHIDDVQSSMVSNLSSVIGLVGPPADGVDIALPIRPLPMFSTVASEALGELEQLSCERSVVLTDRKSVV